MIYLCECGHIINEKGYFIYDENGHTVCIGCSIEIIKEEMIQEGKYTLYYSKNQISDVTGNLKFETLKKKISGSHNIAKRRVDVWFKGPDNKIWWGVQYGVWNEILHCKRTKQTMIKK